jgi:hypothetical protein
LGGTQGWIACHSVRPREHAGVESGVDTERILDSSCVPGGHELVGHIHDLIVGWVRRTVVIDTCEGEGKGGGGRGKGGKKRDGATTRSLL